MIRAVSLFAGCGGFDLGLYAAAEALGVEVEVVAAYDSMPCAVAAYNANLPHPVAEVRDVKTMQRDDLPPHDLVIGGPPCQPFSMAGKRKGADDDRNCLPDFLRLAGDGPFIMENVVARLINAGWSERLCAADFGDVTSRKRWFYSNYLLHVVPTPGPRRIRDIRDHAEDARVLAKRATSSGPANRKDGSGKGNVADDSDFMPSMTAGNGASSGFNRVTIPGCKAGAHGHYDEAGTLDTISAHSWHGHDIRGSGKLVAIAAHVGNTERAVMDGDFLPTVFSKQHNCYTKRGMESALQEATLKLGLRGNSASAFEDDAVLGSFLANSFHANEASKLVGCRNPSLLEMARAHSIPDSFDWCGATKTQRGQMIANSIPVGMATAVCKAMLLALSAVPA